MKKTIQKHSTKAKSQQRLNDARVPLAAMVSEKNKELTHTKVNPGSIHRQQQNQKVKAALMN